jgi:hypothetical protein
MEGDWIMPTVSNIGKIAYIYDGPSDTWNPVAGMTDTSAEFNWTNNHKFSSSANLRSEGSFVAAGGVNSFSDINDRNVKIPSPVNGTLALVVVNNVIQPQYFYNGAWRLIGSNAFLEEVTSSNFVNNNIYNIKLSDAGKTLEMNSSATHIVTIPLNSSISFPIGTQIAFIQSGTGQTQFVGAASGIDSVSILSKNNNRKLSSRYSQAILVKRETNTWYLVGDLTA